MEKSIPSKWRQLIRMMPAWLLRKLTNRQFLVVAAIIVGLWAGLTAVVLKVAVHLIQQELILLGRQYTWLYFAAPTIGIFSTFLFVRFIMGGSIAKGTSHVLLAIAKKSSFIPKREVFSHAITSALTVGMGGSAGLESPIVQTGSAIGSTFASLFPLGYRDRTLLLACGAAAGIATAFNAPIAGVLFALEVLLVDVNISAFIPLLIAGATGALCSKIILSEDILISFRQTSSFNYYNVPYYILLGLGCGLVSVFYVRTFLGTEALFNRIFRNGLTRLIFGCFLLGMLIMIFPALFGEGYTSIRSLAQSEPEQLFNGSPLYHFFTQSSWLLGLAVFSVSLIKVFAVSLTLNAGGNGGNFAPALLVGACLGFSFSFLFNLSGLGHVPTSNFALVAMAGVLTGIFHSPLTAIFLIAEITGGYELIIPLMIVSALSTAVSKYLGPYSLDEARLKQTNNLFSMNKDTHILSELSIGSIIENDFAVIPFHSSLRSLVNAVARSKRNVFPVVNDAKQLVGLIALEEIREIMFDSSLYDKVTVDQLMRSPLVIVTEADDMASVMEKFDKSGVWNIPVLKNGVYVGFVSKSTVFSNYRDQLRRS